MFKIFRKQIPGENGRIPNDESGSIFVPGYHIVDGVIVDELIRLGEKRRGNRSLRITGRGLTAMFHRRRSHSQAEPRKHGKEEL